MFEGKKILITGGTGTLGRELVRRLLPHNPKEIVIFSRDECKQVVMKEKYPGLTYRLGDVGYRSSLERAMVGVDIVFHLAASKHADISEKEPFQAVLSNVVGSLNVVETSLTCGVESVVGISTDKAVEPTNLYGMTKAIMEYLFLRANGADVPTKYFVVRFGNLFGSAGSVVEKWHRDAAAGKKLKVSDPDMCRFFFTNHEAVDLIFEALKDDDPECVYSTNMHAMKIGALAEVMQTVGVEFIGNRGNEKLHEALITADEMKRTTLEEFTTSDLIPLMLFKIGPKKITDAAVPYDGMSFTTETVPWMNKDQIGRMVKEYKESLK